MTLLNESLYGNPLHLATEPAVKVTIAAVSWLSIIYVATHAQNWYGTSCALLTGIMSVVVRTYQMPPLHDSCTS
jgi:hypothetical protein